MLEHAIFAAWVMLVFIAGIKCGIHAGRMLEREYRRSREAEKEVKP